MSLPAGESTPTNHWPARPVSSAVGPTVAGVFIAYDLAAVAFGVGSGFGTPPEGQRSGLVEWRP